MTGSIARDMGTEQLGQFKGQVVPFSGMPAVGMMQKLVAASCDPSQYDQVAAAFFDEFNSHFDRTALFYGYLAGHINGDSDNSRVSKKIIKGDFGCGGAQLTRRLAGHAEHMIGIDRSEDMRRLAFSKTPQKLIHDGRIKYVEKVPADAVGKCDFVSAVLVHFHFHPYDSLVNKFFKPIASMLQPGGKATLIGTPSDYVHMTPDHYQNCVHLNDIPPDVRKESTSLELLADKDGYVALANLKAFPLEDGTQMKVTFFMPHAKGPTKFLTLKDTFWRDETLIRAAKEVGLEHVGKDILTWTDPVTGADHTNAYMGLRFRKPIVAAPPSL